MTSIPVEVCINSQTLQAVQQSARAAALGGASRIELCSQMELQGLTPDEHHIRAARVTFAQRGGFIVMIRPRGGDFNYSIHEIERMLKQIEAVHRAGADGVALGVLQHDRIASQAMRALVTTARDRALSVTFHRAFDVLADPQAALEELIDLGVDRILTSGTAWGSGGTVLDGIERIGGLIQQAGQRVEIVVGGGLQLSNVRQVVSQLPLAAGRVSIHAYSAVLRHGVTDRAAVQQLVRLVNGEATKG